MSRPVSCISVSCITAAALFVAIVGSASTISAQTEAVTSKQPGAAAVFDPEIRARNATKEPAAYRKLVAGLYARRIIEAASTNGDYSVQVWGLTVSPGARTEAVELPGAAVLLLRAGGVVLVTGEEKRTLEPGGTALAREGAAVRFINPDEERPAQLRAVVLSGNR